MSFIYQAVVEDKRWIPPKESIIEFPTQKEAIDWLQTHGGGIFRDKLCNMDVSIP